MANYIKYGDVDVDQEAYLKKIADEEDAYVESQPWSTKQKDRWRQAYSDIVSRGITGASVATEGQDAGRWQVNYNGDSIPIESMSDKDKRAYRDVAYFLKTQMESLSTPKEEVKENLPVFDNKTFITGLNQQMTSKLFGGHSWTTQEDWNPKDERDETGKRGTKNRAELLAQQLELYRDSLKEGQYSFEGSPFENLEDFKGRINDAIAALRTEDPKDDLDALNKIGLKYRDFLYDGLDDTWENQNGTSISYAQRNKLLEDQKKAQIQAQEQALLHATQPSTDSNAQVAEEKKPSSYFSQIRNNIKQFRESLEQKAKEPEGSIDWGPEEITRVASAFTDATGIGLTFVPVVGNTIGAATGVVGSVGNFAADIMHDGLDWGDVGNFGLNLLFDVGTLIPGIGTAAKAGKLSRAIGKWVPRIVAGITAIEGLKEGPAIVKSFKKLSTPTEVTSTDLQNMARGISLLMGGVSSVRALRQSSNAKKMRGTESSSAEVTTKKGRQIKLTDEEYKTLTNKDVTREVKNKIVKEKADTKGVVDAEDELLFEGWGLRNPTKTKKNSTVVDRKSLSKPVEGVSGYGASRKQFEEQWLARHKNWARLHQGIINNTPFISNKNQLRWTNYGLYNYGAVSPENPNPNKIHWWDSPYTRWEKRQKANQLSTQKNQPQKQVIENSPLNPTKSLLDIRRGVQIPYKNVNLKERELIESFQQSYGLGGLKPTSMRNGFGGNAIKAGKYENELLTITLSKNEAKELRNNPGKLAEFRGKNAAKVQEIISQKKATDEDVVKIIQGLKRKGYLKQGGIVDNNNKLLNIIKDVNI